MSLLHLRCLESQHVAFFKQEGMGDSARTWGGRAGKGNGQKSIFCILIKLELPLSPWGEKSPIFDPGCRTIVKEMPFSAHIFGSLLPRMRCTKDTSHIQPFS